MWKPCGASIRAISRSRSGVSTTTALARATAGSTPGCCQATGCAGLTIIGKAISPAMMSSICAMRSIRRVRGTGRSCCRASSSKRALSTSCATRSGAASAGRMRSPRPGRTSSSACRSGSAVGKTTGAAPCSASISRSALARRFGWRVKSGTCRKPVQWREWREGGCAYSPITITVMPRSPSERTAFRSPSGAPAQASTTAGACRAGRTGREERSRR